PACALGVMSVAATRGRIGSLGDPAAGVVAGPVVRPWVWEGSTLLHKTDRHENLLPLRSPALRSRTSFSLDLKSCGEKTRNQIAECSFYTKVPQRIASRASMLLTAQAR